jgi:hypothetical protein
MPCSVYTYYCMILHFVAFCFIQVWLKTGDPNKFMFVKDAMVLTIVTASSLLTRWGINWLFQSFISLLKELAYICSWIMQNVSSGPYLCPKHTKCHRCASSVPRNGSSVRYWLFWSKLTHDNRIFSVFDV